MKRLTVKDLSVEEKLRLLCSKGFWYTMDFDGKLPSVSYPSAQLLANTWNKALIFPNIS